MNNIKLNDIMKKLSLRADENNQPADLILLLPDSYDKSLCKDQSYVSLQNELFRDTKNLLKGNWRNDNFFVATGTKELRKHLQKNEEIVYSDGRPSVKAVDNMLEKLKNLVISRKMTSSDRLFVKYHAKEHWHGNDAIFEAYDRCLKDGSVDALTYALFYLVLASIFHVHTYEFFGFYSEERLDRVLGKEKAKDTVDGVLCDPQYLNKYKVYCPRSNYSDIQYDGELDLSERGKAILKLSDDKGLYRRIYTGIPWYNEMERLVYFIGHSEKQRLCILVFRYEPFDNAPMYYRRAFLVTLNRDQKQPEIRKAVICKRDCSEDIDVIKGMLRMTNGSFAVREEAIENFLLDIQQYEWFSHNQEAILQFLSTKKQELYYINELELFSNSSLVMKDVERMKMIKLLVSRSLAERYISLEDLPNIHKFMDPSDKEKES